MNHFRGGLMKRCSRPRKTAHLSEFIHRQLNMYALAAGAAGVGILAVAQPAEAKIVYTRSHRVIGINQHFDLDLNHDGKTDFTVGDTTHYSTSGGVNLLIASGARTNEVEGNTATRGFLAAALKKGAVIPKGHFSHDGRMISYCSGFLSCAHTHRIGSWFNVTNRYLGLKFKIDNKIHYGWARLSVQFAGRIYVTTTLTGYAYETIPGKAIKAGQTKEAADDLTNEDFGPGASLNNLLPTPQAASLGMLALGVEVVPLRRRKEYEPVVQGN
jgi:hypothetical protein